jgi:hypothetical protein
VSSTPEVLAAGAEPRGRVRVGWSVPPTWRRVGLAAVVLVVVVAALASWWGGRPVPPRTIAVSVDQSEYTLPHRADPAGYAPLLLLLRVVSSGGSAQSLAVTDIHGSGIDANGTFLVASSGTHRAVVPAQVWCRAWVGGTGVRVRVLVGEGSGAVAREVTLDLGPGAPLHAQLDETCARWRAENAPGGVLLVGADQGRPARAAAVLGAALAGPG